MIALCVALVALLAGSLGLNGWLTFKTIRKVETGADVSIALGATEAELERVQGDNKLLDQKLSEANATLEHVREELIDAKSQPSAAVGAGLAADDVAGRSVRFIDKYKARSGARDGAVLGGTDEVLSQGRGGVAPGRPTTGAADADG